ncbi:MAG: hypothetical protein U0Q12_22525 [Vicinamibacterales bacterium]
MGPAFGDAALVVYIAGALVGLVRTESVSPLERVALAILWPVGPLAFVLTVALMVAVACVAWPWLGVAAALGGATAWWALR